MTDPGTSSIVLTHVGSALAVVGVIQKLKAAKWVQPAKKLICRTASVISAIAVHIGITVTWSHVSGGGWTGIVAIPSVSVMAVTVFHIAEQFFYQETGYQALSAIQFLEQIAKSLPKGSA